jgi:ubiquinone/menaquinone biosynthesis C-methylase UbiE
MTTSRADVPIGNTYDKYASRNPVARYLMSGFMRDLDAVLPAGPVASILEIGMGEGEIATHARERYPDARIVGLDLPDADLAGQWAQRRLTGVFGDAGAPPFPDNTFDLVLAIEVLEHVENPAKVLEQLARVASGAVVLSVPREPIWRALNLVRGAYVREWGNTPGHVQHWSRHAFAALVGEQFDVSAVKSPLPWTLVTARVRS